MNGSTESNIFVLYGVSTHIDILLKLYTFVIYALYLHYVKIHGMCRIENVRSPSISSETADREAT